jgi:hypothetical protein
MTKTNGDATTLTDAQLQKAYGPLTTFELHLMKLSIAADAKRTR